MITGSGLTPGEYDIGFSGTFLPHGPLLPPLLADAQGNADYQDRFWYDGGTSSTASIDWLWSNRFDQQSVSLTHTGWQTGGDLIRLSGQVSLVPEPAGALLLLAGVVAVLAIRPAHAALPVASR